MIQEKGIKIKRWRFKLREEERENEVEVENKFNSLLVLASLLGYKVDVYNVPAGSSSACRQIHINIEKNDELIEFILYVFKDSRRLCYYEILIENSFEYFIHKRNENILSVNLDKALEFIK